jgi:hypothetical protein
MDTMKLVILSSRIVKKGTSPWCLFFICFLTANNLYVLKTIVLLSPCDTGRNASMMCIFNSALWKNCLLHELVLVLQNVAFFCRILLNLKCRVVPKPSSALLKFQTAAFYLKVVKSILGLFCINLVYRLWSSVRPVKEFHLHLNRRYWFLLSETVDDLGIYKGFKIQNYFLDTSSSRG